jgi:hypothetical protein
MIDAMIRGKLVNKRTVDDQVEGRIVMPGDQPIQFTARRGTVKQALLDLPDGVPICATGTLSTSIGRGKDGLYVRHDLAITAILSIVPAKQNNFTSMLRGAI